MSETNHEEGMVPSDSLVTHAELDRMEAKNQRRNGLSLLIIALVFLAGLLGSTAYLEDKDRGRDRSEGEVLVAIQDAQDSLTEVLSRASRNTTRTCSTANGTAVLFRVLAEEADLVTPAVDDALSDLEASVAQGCEDVPETSSTTTTVPG